jgi:hypothetical protein
MLQTNGMSTPGIAWWLAVDVTVVGLIHLTQILVREFKKRGKGVSSASLTAYEHPELTRSSSSTSAPLLVERRTLAERSTVRPSTPSPLSTTRCYESSSTPRSGSVRSSRVSLQQTA